MTYQAFEQALGNPQPVYLFTGAEEYGKKQALEHLKSALLPVGLEMLNYAVLENVTAGQIIDAAEAMPMMCERRIVEVRDWVPFFSAKSKNEEEEVQRMIAWLDSPPPTCTLIFYLRTEPDARKKITKALIAKQAQVDFGFLSDSELYRWGSAYVKAQGCGMDKDAMAQLTFAAGRERTRLVGELDKLCAYAGKNNTISIEHVDAVVTPSLEYTVFKLTDYLLEGNLRQAQSTIQALLLQGERYSSILSFLTRQMRILTHTRLAIDENHLQETQAQLELKPFPAKIAAVQARKHPAEVFEELYMLCTKTLCESRQGKLGEREAFNFAFLSIFQKFSAKK